jgi:hypothetical protein
MDDKTEIKWFIFGTYVGVLGLLTVWGIVLAQKLDEIVRRLP